MDYEHVEDYSVFPWPERLWFVALFLVAAVAVARLRPRWLFALWMNAWLLAVAGTLLSLGPGAPSVPAVAEAVVVSGVTMGATILWLHLSRRRRWLALAPVQAAGAVAAFVAGLVIAVMLAPLAG